MPSQVVHQIDNYTYLRRINNIKHPQDDGVFRNVTIPQQNALRNVKLNNVSTPLGFNIVLTNRQLLQGVVLFILLLSLLLEFLTHLHIDYAKSKFRVANQQRIDQSRSLRLAMHALDQFLHAFFILCCTAVCTMLFSFE
ncbi:Bacteriophage_phiKZ [Hexamita inflata]|uniref:Orf197 n=1 Tax=Hexamita inflata TaxID=28002 RepID=A0AA86NEY2_9EUKA|nr:Bacteriophage phiKZ [Hexamita inflata]